MRRQFFFRIHAAVGLLLLMAFLGTGQLLSRVVTVEHATELVFRAMSRASHAYLLFSSLLHFWMAVVRIPEQGKARGVSLVGRAMVTAGTLALVAAFFLEPSQTVLDRPITVPSVIALLAGTVLSVAATIYDDVTGAA